MFPLDLAHLYLYFMLDKSILNAIMIELTSMKVSQSSVLSSSQAAEIHKIGAALARLRIARGIKQDQAALRAALSRNTAYRLEKGDPGIAVGQILRYLDAIAPGKTLLDLLTESDPALVALHVKEQRRRARELSKRELDEIDF
jgi:transcriptional regulator with XRE-family HTH domain